MDPAYHAIICLKHATALADLDGAVVELQVRPGTDPDEVPIVAGEIRIPGPPVP